MGKPLVGFPNPPCKRRGRRGGGSAEMLGTLRRVTQNPNNKKGPGSGPDPTRPGSKTVFFFFFLNGILHPTPLKRISSAKYLLP